MFPLRSLVIGVCCLLTAVVFSQVPHQPPASAEKRHSQRHSNDHPKKLGGDCRATLEDSPSIDAALNTKVTLNFEKTPLRKALDEIAKQIGVEIVLGEHHLRKNKLDVDTPVTFTAKGWRAESVLNVLFQLPGLQKLTWLPRHGILLVLPQDDADEMEYARAFARDELLKFERAYRSFEDQIVYSGASAHFFTGALPVDALGTKTVAAIYDFTAGPWLDVDGTGGTVSTTDSSGTLVVRSTLPVMREVEQLLDAMHAFTRGELEGKPRVIPSRYAPRISTEVWQRTLNRRVKLVRGEWELHLFVEWLREQLDRPVWVDEAALATEGVKLLDLVHVDVKSIPLSGALDLVLTPLHLACVLEGDVVHITTIVQADEMMYSVAYDVRDFHRAGFRVELSDIIQNTTTGPWIDIVGTGGTIDDPLPGLIVVRQSQAMHREVEHVLAEMRRTDSAVIANRQTADCKVDRSRMVTAVLHPNIKDLPAAIGVLKQLVEPAAWQGQGGSGQFFIVDKTLMVRCPLRVLEKTHRQLDAITDSDTFPPHILRGFGGTAAQ